MAAKGIQILIAVIPPDSPGSSIRTVFDPDLPPGLMGHQIGEAAYKLIKKMRKPKKEAASE